MSKALNLTGQRFGMLVALEKAEKKTTKHVDWKCLCDCGKLTTVRADNLKNGNIKSCGCHMPLSTADTHTTHGMSYTRLYKTWCNMKSRCYNEHTKHFMHYGGRGIKVCDEWKDSFEAFMQWALSNGYSDALTIDRIDVDGNYEPSNCRWATMLAQNRNKRSKKTASCC